MARIFSPPMGCVRKSALSSMAPYPCTRIRLPLRYAPCGSLCGIGVFSPWSRRLRIRSLVRGALLHDYFLYDWHVPAKWHRLHGFHHAARAYRNAKRDFALNALEENMIRAHMFPLGIVVPRYRESWILWTADKICALRETIRR